MKRVVTIILALCCIFAVTACGKSPVDILGNAMGSSSSSGDAGVVKAVDGYAEGRMGDVLRNKFFEYSVESARLVDEYNGLKPSAGMTLLDAEVKIKNIFGSEIPMFSSDFQVQWGDTGESDFSISLPMPEDTSVIPEEFALKRGETVTYHVVAEVPEGSTEFSISYLEIFEDDSEGDVFFVYFEI